MSVVMVVGMPRAAAIMSAHVSCVWELVAKTKTKKKKVGKEWTIDLRLFVPRCKGSKQVGRICRRPPFLYFFIMGEDWIGMEWVIIMSRTNESDAW